MKKVRLTAVFALSVSLLLMTCACSAVSGVSAVNEETAEIALSDDGVTITGGGAESVGNIITISSPGTYTLEGSLTDGQVYVDAGTEGTVNIILSDASITNTTDPAIYIEQADKSVITLQDGTENVVTSGETLTDAADTTDSGDDAEDDTGAAIYSKDDLTITGGGSLTVSGFINNGIQSKDDLTIESGFITVTAANNAIKGKDSVTILDGTFNITAIGDGIKSDNTEEEAKGTVSISGGTFTIDAQGDAVQAETTLNISGGEFDVLTAGGSANAETIAGETGNMGGGRFNGGGMQPSGGGMQGPGATDGTSVTQSAYVSELADTETAIVNTTDTVSCKGFKGGTSVTITGGTFTIDACDDAVHSGGDITISGGTFDIKSGDDGVHADGALTIENGTVGITESYEGLEGQSVTINAGEISVVSSDDGINAAGGADSSGVMGAWAQDSFSDSGDIFIRIAGGLVTIDAGGDGIDSNGDLYMEGGDVYVDGPENSGNGALDSGAESGGECTVSGGTIIAVGASGMAEGFDANSTQYSFLYNFSSTISADSEITVKDSEGNIVLEYTATKTFSSIVVSSPELKEGETYTVTAGDQSAEITMSSIAVNASGGAGVGSGGKGMGSSGGGMGQRPTGGDAGFTPRTSGSAS
ncbi:MAG: carbohydrate-binding domain-containing protein [Oscillospiraceae bacterium]